MSQTTGQQHVTPELRRWVAEQTARGMAHDSLLASMIDHGWDAAIARAALAAMPSGTRVPQAMAAPEIRLAALAPHPVEVLVSLHEPQLVVFGQLLSAEECEGLMALAAPRLARSQTVQLDTGGNEVTAARTSEGMFFERGENPVCAAIEARIARLLGWPVDHGEGLQILRYPPGAEYKPHYDYFDPAQPGTPAILRRGGQRVATLVIYLNTPARGGATVFPDVGLEVAPVQGNAVFFSYDRADPSTRTLHGGAPVLEGEKWVATKWLREGVFT